MKKAISESSRRRTIQLEFNRQNSITPRSIQKAIKEGIEDLQEAQKFVSELTGQERDDFEMKQYIAELEYEMELAARNLHFEKAAQIRDEIKKLKDALNR
jgi:excinuclease ABC subunit B